MTKEEFLPCQLITIINTHKHCSYLDNRSRENARVEDADGTVGPDQSGFKS